MSGSTENDLERFARQHDGRATAPLVCVVRTPGAELVVDILRHLVPALGAEIETRPFADCPPRDCVFSVALMGADDLANAPSIVPTTTVLALRDAQDRCDLDEAGLDRLMAKAIRIVHAGPENPHSFFQKHIGSKWLRGTHPHFPGRWFLSQKTILYEQEDPRDIGPLLDLKDSAWMATPPYAAFTLAAIEVVVRNPAAFPWHARWQELGRQMKESEYSSLERDAWRRNGTASMSVMHKFLHVQSELALHTQALAHYRALEAERTLTYEKPRWLETIRRALATMPSPAGSG